MCVKCSSDSSRPNKPRTTHLGEGHKERSEQTKRMSKKFNKKKSFSHVEMTSSPILAEHCEALHFSPSTEVHMLSHCDVRVKDESWGAFVV